MMQLLLSFVKKHDDGSEQYDMKNFIVQHEYKVLNTRYNMNMELKRHEKNVSTMREGVAFEERHSDIPYPKFSFKFMFKGMTDT